MNDNLEDDKLHEEKLNLFKAYKKQYYAENQKPQQTAVEWLIEQLQASCKVIPSHVIEQAKQMEKQQSDADYLKGYQDGSSS